MAAQLLNWAKALPAFEVLALAFAIGSVLVALWGRATTGGFTFLRQPWHYYAIITALVFINNAGYVFGLRHAPIVAANLVNYLWPIFIILLSVPVLKRPLRPYHMLGALLGFGGCCLLILQGADSLRFEAAHLPGYGAALTGALSWAVYSLVLKRHYAHVPTASLCVVFLGVSLLSFMMFPFAVKPWRLPGPVEWGAICAAGFGTLALAYACWDYGAKKGDIRVMGVASYITPLLSTAVLALLGGVEVTAVAWLSCALIIAGAVVGGWKEIQKSA